VVNTVSSKIKTISDNNDVEWGMFQLTSVPVLLDVVVILLSLFVVLTPNGNCWVVPLLHSVSDIFVYKATWCLNAQYNNVKARRRENFGY
jgi:hypothetical protein